MRFRLRGSVRISCKGEESSLNFTLSSIPSSVPTPVILDRSVLVTSFSCKPRQCFYIIQCGSDEGFYASQFILHGIRAKRSRVQDSVGAIKLQPTFGPRLGLREPHVRGSVDV